MTPLLTTLMIAFVVIMIAIALMAIGWLVTGKSKIVAGACGRDPTKKSNKDEGCGTTVSCQLCDKPAASMESTSQPKEKKESKKEKEKE